MIDPIAMLRPRRKIAGISAILLPFTADGSTDWPEGFRPSEHGAAAESGRQWWKLW